MGSWKQQNWSHVFHHYQSYNHDQYHQENSNCNDIIINRPHTVMKDISVLSWTQWDAAQHEHHHSHHFDQHHHTPLQYMMIPSNNGRQLVRSCLILVQWAARELLTQHPLRGILLILIIEVDHNIWPQPDYEANFPTQEKIICSMLCSLSHHKSMCFILNRDTCTFHLPNDFAAPECRMSISSGKILDTFALFTSSTIEVECGYEQSPLERFPCESHGRVCRSATCNGCIQLWEDKGVLTSLKGNWTLGNLAAHN